MGGLDSTLARGASGLVGCLLSATAYGQACCGGSVQDTPGSAATRIPTGSGAVFASLEGDVRFSGGVERSDGPEVAPLFEQALTLHQIALSVEAAFSQAFSVLVTQPFVANHYRLVAPEGEEFDGWANGAGDLAVLGKLRLTRYRRGRSEPAILALSGFRVPTGRDDLRDDEIGRFPPSVQPGTGAWSGLLGLSVALPLSNVSAVRPVVLYASSLGRASTANGDGYQFGPALINRLGAGVLLWRVLSLQGGLGAALVAADSLHGEHVLSTGSAQFTLDTTATVLATRSVWMFAGARFPFYRRVRGTQLTEAAAALAGLRYAWEPKR